MSNPLKIKSVGPYDFQGDMIGEGAFSVVRLCKKKGTNEYIACKIVEKKRIDTSNLENRFEAEIRINQQLHHPGVVQMLDLYSDATNYFIFMEFCQCGDLFQYIVDHKRLKESVAKPLFKQILETIKYVHQMGISHRDLKPENILIMRDGRIKISDFGLSRFVKPGTDLVDTPCGSPCYASPECISGRSYNGYTTDIWSCGVILYAMLTGQLPWTKRNQTQLFQQIRRGEYTIPDFLSYEARNMIKSLMTVNIQDRYTVDEALNDPWLADVSPQFDAHDARGYVSLREVDLFFNKRVPDLELGDGITQQNSCSQFTFAQVAHMLPKKHKKKRHHHKGDGETQEPKKRRKKKSKHEPAADAAAPVAEVPAKDEETPRRATFVPDVMEMMPRPRQNVSRTKIRPPSAAILQSSLSSKPAASGKRV